MTAIGIQEQIAAALNAAHHENEYPHEYERDPGDIAREIHDWSGLSGFDPDDPKHLGHAGLAVAQWREKNPA